MHSQKEIAKALVLFFVLAVAMTWPLARHLTDHIPSDLGDPLYAVWIMDWDIHALKTGFKDFWNGNIFFPHQGTVLYMDYYFALALLAFPLAALFHNIIFSYNVLFILSFVLCALGVYFLVYYLTRVRAAAVVAGIVIAFCPFRMAHISHIELLYFAWIPFCFLFLLRFFDNPSYKNLAGVGIFFILQTLSCAYYGVFLSLFVGLFILYFGYKRKFFKRKNFWIKMSLLAFSLFLILLPLFYPYLRVHKQMMFTRELQEAVLYSAQLQDFLRVPPWNTVWGDLLRGQPSSEWQRYPGVVVFLLGAWWLVSRRRSRREEMRRERSRLFFWWDILTGVYLLLLLHVAWSGGFTIQWGKVKILSFHRLVNPLIILVISLSLRIGLAIWRRRKHSWPDIPTASLSQRFFLFSFVLAWLLAMGPSIKLFGKNILTGPYILLHEWIPVFQSLRAPSRLSVMMMISLALMSGWAIAALMEKTRKLWLKKAVPILIGILILIDYASVPLPLDTSPGLKKIPEIYNHVKTLPAGTSLIELPMPPNPVVDRGREALLMYYSTFHRKKIVNGYSGYLPPGYTIIYESMEAFPSDETFRLLRDLEVDYVLIHTQGFRAEKGAQMQAMLRVYPDRVELKAAAGGDFLYRLLPREEQAAEERRRWEVGDRRIWEAWSSSNVFKARLAIDGDVSTGWTTRIPQRDGDFFYLDLGEPVQAGEVELSLYRKPLNYPRGFLVESSLDGKNWALINWTPFLVPHITRANIEDMTQCRLIISFEPIMLRYLRIKLTRSHPVHHWSIQEIYCYGVAPQQ
ncbi:MAG: discoidin domain-containing protein [Clostridiales bacterium]|nr:discoidin domain-containing protein [Clostridiales bacterium]